MDASDFETGPGSLPGVGGVQAVLDPGEGSSGPVSRASIRALAVFLRRIRRRVLADRFLRNVAVDLAVSLSVLAGLIVIDRVFVPGTLTPALAGVIFLVSLVTSFVRTAILSPLDLFRTAILADSRLGLKERVSSAVYIARSMKAGAAEPGWDRMIALDAARSLSGIRLAESFPVRVPRRHLAATAIACAGCAALALWFPAFDVLGITTRKEAAAKAKESVREEEKKLAEDLTELVKKAEDPALRQLLEALARQAIEPRKEPSAGEKQKNEAGSGDPKKEALVNLTRREDEIKQAMTGKKLEPLKDAKHALEKLDMKGADVTKKLRESLKEGDFEKAKKDLDELKGELSDLAGKKPEDLTAAEKERLAKLSSELQKLASDSKALSKLSQALSSASSGISSKDFQGSLESMQLSSEELESLAKLAQEADVLDQALALVQLSKEELQSLQSCPECGTPYCKDCGKPQCSCKPGNKPGGT